MATQRTLDDTALNGTAVPSSRPTSPVALAVFWAGVSIPLAWGVINTLVQAVKLFR
ncbi:MFS transporter small subunit [Chitinasiproducens palmae]|uniref:Oxalate:formate antiporter n=1 Tax=Chitinasiproducens palmae TaxID=1770053 RepID=A0A1H2PKN0_9BURK|nr:oxalate:formate antiporter [Chitinasiproducens palmae]SDV46128.1 hypothetical protein SAMN05216551_101101 [Chitinasiproducens palmae]